MNIAGLAASVRVSRGGEDVAQSGKIPDEGFREKGVVGRRLQQTAMALDCPASVLERLLDVPR